jgi:hypothetical protein
MNELRMMIENMIFFFFFCYYRHDNLPFFSPEILKDLLRKDKLR